MNADDPRFTAYALDELEPAERAAVEAELREQPALGAEMEELRSFMAQLRGQLQAEEGAPLSPDQRAAVLGQAPRVVTGPSVWWRRPWLQSAAAACVIVGSIALYFVRMEVKRPQDAAAAARRDGMKLAMEPEPVATDMPVETDSLAVQTPAPVAKLADARSNAETTLHLEASSPVALDRYAATAPLAAPPRAVSLAEPKGAINTPGSSISPNGFDQIHVPVIKGPSANGGTGALAMTKPAAAAGLPAASAMRKSSAEQNRLAWDAAKTGERGTINVTNGGALADRSRQVARQGGVQPFTESAAVGKRGVTRDEGDLPSGRTEEISERSAPGEAEQAGNTEAYDSITDNTFCTVRDQPRSTFSVDVDTASYANVRRFLNANERPPRGAVRIEELVNYFRYDYPQPEGEDPVACKTEVATCPWQTEHRLVRIGLKGRELKRESRPPANLVFLIDVSGSMQPENRLPLVKQSLHLLIDQLGAEDTVAIAVYAGNSGCVLEPTHDRNKMRAALDRLEAGGSTNGAAGIQLAYDLAQRSFKRGGMNRVILCTDGDFNVGVTSQSELVSMIQGKAKTGIFLSVFGVGFGNLKDATLEKLADKGNGNYAYIDTLAEGRKVFVEQMAGTLFTIAKDVKVQVEFNPAQVAAYRLIGYEDRLLAKEDFNDDTKDAGEIGAGHTVTALYEVVPAGREVPDAPPLVEELKYQKASKPGALPAEAGAGGEPPSRELLTVKVRYKQPDGDVSKKLEFPLTDRGETWEKSSRDFRWAASVASFGLLLRDSPHKGSANWNMTLELATEGKGDDRDGYRSEFVGLVEKAKALSR